MLIRGQADLPGIQVVEDDVVGVDEPDPDDDASDPELAAPAAPEATAKPVRVHDPARQQIVVSWFAVCCIYQCRHCGKPRDRWWGAW